MIPGVAGQRAGPGAGALEAGHQLHRPASRGRNPAPASRDEGNAVLAALRHYRALAGKSV